MTATLVDHGNNASSFASGTDGNPWSNGKTHRLTIPAGAAAGDMAVWFVAYSIPGTGVDTVITVPSGPATALTGFRSGTPSIRILIVSRTLQTADFVAGGGNGYWDLTYTVAANVVSHYARWTGADSTTPISGATWNQPGTSGTTRTTASITVDGTQYVVYGFNDRTPTTTPVFPAGENSLVSSPPQLVHTNQSADVNLAESTGAGVLASGSYTRSMTAAGSTSVWGAFIFAVNAAPTAATAALSGSGTLTASGFVAGVGTAALSGSGSLTATGSPATAASVALSGSGALQQSTPVQRFLAAAPMYVAHRGGSADWPEETLYAYAQAASWKADMALEVSMWQSADGVWVASHDQTTGRVFSGTSLDIPTNTWATLSTKTTIIGSKPIAKVTDILDLYATGNRVIFVDNKNGQDTTGFYAMLATYGGNARFIIKAGGTATSWAPTASSRGYQSWGYFYHTDYANVPTLETYWTILGMEYAGDSSDWSQIKSYSKPVLAHIIATAANKATAAAFSPDGYMVSGVTEAVPQDPVAAGFTGSGSLTVSASPTISAAASFTGAGSLTAISQPGFSAAVSLSGAGTLTTAGKPSTTASASFSGVGTLTGIGSGGSNPTASLSGAGTLSVTATPSFSASVTLSGVGTLTASAKATIVGLATLSGSGTITTTVAPSSAASVLFSGAGNLIAGDANPTRDITLVSIPGSLRWASIPGSERWATIPEVT